MFGEPLFGWSGHVRAVARSAARGVATFGLLAVIWGCARRRPDAVPFAVGAYITAAYWFTASTSFANPAVTLARSVTDTFAGIRIADVQEHDAGSGGRRRRSENGILPPPLPFFIVRRRRWGHRES